MALRDALHPTSGQRQEHFRGLREGSLKAILRNRFTVWKKDRERHCGGQRAEVGFDRSAYPDKDGKIRPVLANLILILREASRWKGVLGYDEFAARVVIKRPPPWGREPLDSPWSDHHKSLARAWFQNEGIDPAAGIWGGRCKRRLDTAFHPVRTYLTPSCGTAYPAWTHGSLLTSTSRIAHTSARSGHVT